MKKFFAGVMDIIFMVILGYLIYIPLGILFYNYAIANGITKENMSPDALAALNIIDFLLKVSILLVYLGWIPKWIGNTFGRKILNIQDKLDFLCFFENIKRNFLLKEYPEKNLKKNEILKVSPKDDYWICPSCNEKNLEIQDVCSNCEQEIEK